MFFFLIEPCRNPRWFLTFDRWVVAYCDRVCRFFDDVALLLIEAVKFGPSGPFSFPNPVLLRNLPKLLSLSKTVYCSVGLVVVMSWTVVNFLLLCSSAGKNYLITVLLEVHITPAKNLYYTFVILFDFY